MASVPRLTPLYRARITTSSDDGAGSGSGRISPRPGAAIQNARAVSADMRCSFWCFGARVTILARMSDGLRARAANVQMTAAIAVALLAVAAHEWVPLGVLYPFKAFACFAVVAGLVIAFVDGGPHPFPTFGPANRVTTARAVLVALVVGAIGEPSS